MLSSKFAGFNVHLIQDVKEFEKIKAISSIKVHIGVDTETSGLDHYKDNIAGVCIATGTGYDKDHYHGFYIPVRHIGYKDNLPIDKTIELVQFLVDNFTTVWWNRDFDATMLEKEGLVFPCVGKTHDAQCMAHLVKGDPYPALKDFAHDYLKIDVIHFSDNNAENNNFKTTDPTVSYVYAAQDAIITSLLGRKLWTDYQYIRTIYPIDNKFAECMRRIMYSTDLYLNKEKVEELVKANARELESVKQQIFSMVGYQFKLDSNVDKADALSRFVTLTVKTKSGKYKVDKEVLSSIDHPLAALLLKYANLTKFRSTYLLKMMEFPQPFHINYQHANVATGRLSSGTSKGNSFFAPFNIQNVPKVEVFRYLHYAPVSSPIKWVLDDSPYCSLADGMKVMMADGTHKLLRDVKAGEQVMTNKGVKTVVDCGELKTILKPYEGTRMNKSGEWKYISFFVEGTPWYLDLGEGNYTVTGPTCEIQIRTLMTGKAKGGMRDCFSCPEGYVWLSADYSSQEMVLMANFSNEINLITPLLEGKDIHKHVATQMFGHYDPSHRTIAKIINFASNYGASGYTIGKRLGKSAEEGQELLNKYNNTLSALTRWKREMEKEGRRKGVVFTYFGRPRAVWMYYNSSNRGDIAFGDRTSVNTVVQGSGGDIIRIDHIKFWGMVDPNSKTYDKEFAENIKYAITVHDEINLFVKPEYIQQAFIKLKGLMEMKFPNWKVPLTVTPSIGVDWGHQIELKGFSDSGEPIPDCTEDLMLLEPCEDGCQE